MKHKAFLEAIRLETLGFSLGDPWRSTNESITCIIPIIRESNEKRKYITSYETKGMLLIQDGGDINKAIVMNKGVKPVFLRMGEILKGETQERAITASRIILPKEKVEVDVVCIHASKPIYAGSELKTKGIVPSRDALYAQSNYKVGRSFRAVNQSKSWDADREYHSLAQSSIPVALASTNSDNMSEVHTKVSKEFEQLVKDVPLLDNQIGVALIDSNGFYFLDCFDLHLSWKELKESIVGKESLKIGQKDEEGVFNYKPKKAKGLITEILGKGFDEKVIYEDKSTKTIAIDRKDISGEIALYKDNLIHLILQRK